MTRKQAIAHAANCAEIHGEPWLVFITPAGAKCNQYPGNLHNAGRYAACRASEREIYEQGGAEFILPDVA